MLPLLKRPDHNPEVIARQKIMGSGDVISLAISNRPVVGARTGYKVDVPGPGCVTTVRDMLVLILSQPSLNTGIQTAA